MSKRVNVLRKTPSFRSDERGKLSFKVKIRAINVSWLHVGTGSLKLEVSGNIPDYLAKLKRERKLNLENLKKAIEKKLLTISYDYYECVRYGGKIVIPGSSLKGVCRSRIELLQKADVRGNVGSCFIRASAPIVKKPEKGHHGWRHYVIWGDVLSENRGAPCQAVGKEFYEDILVCNTCDVFGTSGLASKVFFGNLVSNNAEIVKMTLDFNESVEAVKPGGVFEGEIAFISCSLADVGLVFIGLNIHEANKPILIGKSKYRRRLVVKGPSDVVDKYVTFGIVNLNATEIRAPPRFKDYLGKIVKANKFKVDSYGFIVLNGEHVKEFVSKAVSEALNSIPWIKERLKISEVEILKSKGVML